MKKETQKALNVLEKRKEKKETESKLAEEIITYLKKKKVHHTRISPGPYGSMKGVSDFILCYMGRYIAIELKIGKNKPTKLQNEFLESVKKSEGTAIVCRSVFNVEKILQLTEQQCRKEKAYAQNTSKTHKNP